MAARGAVATRLFVSVDEIDKLLLRIDAELRIDMADVRLGGGFGNKEFIGDAFCIPAFGQKEENFDFTRGQFIFRSNSIATVFELLRVIGIGSLRGCICRSGVGGVVKDAHFIDGKRNANQCDQTHCHEPERVGERNDADIAQDGATEESHPAGKFIT